MNTGAILQKHAHRQTPLPKGEWMLRQSWRELLFAHWPMAAQALRPLIPAALTLDTFEREAWVGIVPFQMREVCPRGMPALPYFHASMSVVRHGDTIHYSSQRTHAGDPPAAYRGRYRPIAPVAYATPGSLPFWLTERYCLYTVDKRGQVYRVDIHHGPWPLQAAELETVDDTMARSHGIPLPDTAPLLHYL